MLLIGFGLAFWCLELELETTIIDVDESGIPDDAAAAEGVEGGDDGGSGGCELETATASAAESAFVAGSGVPSVAVPGNAGADELPRENGMFSFASVSRAVSELVSCVSGEALCPL